MEDEVDRREGERREQAHEIRLIRDMVLQQKVLLHEIGRRLLVIEQKVDDKPCAENNEKLKHQGQKIRTQDKIIFSLVGFIGSTLLGILINLGKIRGCLQ